MRSDRAATHAAPATYTARFGAIFGLRGLVVPIALFGTLLLACQSRTIEAHPDEFVGVGVVLRKSPEGTVIGKVVEQGPADGVGLREGDRVVTIDGQYVGDRSLAAVVDLLRGHAGTQVSIGVETVSGRTEVVVTRAKITKSGEGYRPKSAREDGSVVR